MIHGALYAREWMVVAGALVAASMEPTGMKLAARRGAGTLRLSSTATQSPQWLGVPMVVLPVRANV